MLGSAVKGIVIEPRNSLCFFFKNLQFLSVNYRLLGLKNTVFELQRLASAVLPKDSHPLFLFFCFFPACRYNPHRTHR